MPKKLISGPILARLAQSWILILFFFRGFYLYLMLDIVATCHRIQFQGNLCSKLKKIMYNIRKN